jgi:hypothetical protein
MPATVDMTCIAIAGPYEVIQAFKGASPTTSSAVRLQTIEPMKGGTRDG